MEHFNWLVLIFIAGGLLQSLALLGWKVRGVRLFGLSVSLGLGLVIGLLFYVRMDTSDVSWFFYLFLIVYIFIFSLIFIKDVLPVISERTLLPMTIAMWYACLSGLDLQSIFTWAFIVLISLPTLIVLLSAFTQRPPSRGEQTFSYIWYLAVLCFLIYIQLAPDKIAWMLNAGLGLMGAMELLFTGMIAAYLLIHVVYISLPVLIMLPDRGETDYKFRRAMLREYMEVLRDKFSDEQLTYKESILIITLLCGALAANHYLGLVSGHMAVNISALFVPQLMALQKRKSSFRELAEKTGRGPLYPSIHESLLKEGNSREALGRLTEAVRLEVGFEKGDVPVMADLACFLSRYRAHEEAAFLFRKVREHEPRDFISTAMCLRYATSNEYKTFGITDARGLYMALAKTDYEFYQKRLRAMPDVFRPPFYKTEKGMARLFERAGMRMRAEARTAAFGFRKKKLRDCANRSLRIACRLDPSLSTILYDYIE
jgi:hypothetical protein